MDSSLETSIPIGACQTNANPFDPNEPEEWTDYPADISHRIECAYQRGICEISIRTGYRIDFAHERQIHNIDSFRQRPIRRRCQVYNKPILNTEYNHDEVSSMNNRLDFPLESDNVSEDTHYQGSRFIVDWLVTEFKSLSNVTFNRILNLLIK
ncbi:unnamed protein product, partial [Rotaria sp. Silwood2]